MLFKFTSPEAYHSVMKSERTSHISSKHPLAKTNVQRYFDLHVNRDGVKDGKVVKIVVNIKC